MAAKQFSARELERYRRYFRMYDLNGDGAISARELKKVSRQMGYRLSDKSIRVLILLCLGVHVFPTQICVTLT